jgi:hypothetical protein
VGVGQARRRKDRTPVNCQHPQHMLTAGCVLKKSQWTKT